MKSLICMLVVISSFCFAKDIKFKSYKIESGQHYPEGINFKFFSGRELKFQATFDESAKYQFQGEAASDQVDFNKLYGFSDCNVSHTKASARFGWRWKNNRLELSAFTHVEGGNVQGVHGDYEVRSFQGGAPLYEPINLGIKISSSNNEYIYTWYDKDWTVREQIRTQRACDSKRAIKYLLIPYFGGNQPAPHDVFIKIGRVEENSTLFSTLGVSNPYPNPATDHFNLDIRSTISQQFFIRMYDIQGRTVHESDRIEIDQNVTSLYENNYDSDYEYEFEQIRFDMPYNLAAAMYIIRVFSIDDSGTERLAYSFDRSNGKFIKL